MRLRQLLKIKNINQKDLAKKLGLGEPMLSKFSNYLCLPVPGTMKQICKELNCDVLDIYDKEEIEFIAHKKKRTAEQMDCYRLTVNINKNFRKYFEKENLKKLGYDSLKEAVHKLLVTPLMDMSIKRTINEVNEKLRKEKVELDAGTPNPTNVVS